MSRIRELCVFTGSSPGARPEYRAAALELGRLLGERDIRLVYGGATVGLMGAVADAALAAGGRVTGVIPRALMDKELGHAGLTELRVVESMHQRKQAMADRADGFIAMPGGMGTLEELTEILTWAQLGIHGKPCGILNVAGYFDRLLGFLDHAVAERFLRPEHRELLMEAATPVALLDALAAWVPRPVEKWLDRHRT